MNNAPGNSLTSPSTPPAPLLPVAIAVICGILLGRLGLLDFYLAGGMTLIALAGVIGIFVYYRKAYPSQKLHLIKAGLICVGFMGIGALRYALVYHYYPENHIVRYCYNDQSRLATIRGVIVSEPYLAQGKGAMARYDFLHQSPTIFVVQCHEVLTPSGWQTASGFMQTTVNQPCLNLTMGQTIQIEGRISLRGHASNPGQKDRSNYYRARRNLVACSTGQSEAVTILNANKKTVGLVANIRKNIALISRGLLIDDSYYESNETDKNAANESSPGFLAALLLGQRYQISPEMNEKFLRSGTMHFLSLSGLHIGLLAGFIWWGCKLTRLPRGLQGAITLVFVILFLLIVPPRAPIMRAGILSIIFCIAWMTRRVTSPVNLLAFGAVVILLWRPLDLFSAGFQLSFIVVLGLIIFVSPICRRDIILGEPDPNLITHPQEFSDKILPWWKSAVLYCLRALGALTVVSLTAWLAGLPLAAYHFNCIALWGAVASVLLYPLVAFTLLLGLFKLLLTPLLPFAGNLLNAPLDTLSQVIIFIVEKFAQIPYSTINTASPPIWLIIAFYALLIWIGLMVYRRKIIPYRPLYGLIAWLIAFVWLMPFTSTNPNSTTCHLLSVGHGTATVIQLPDGKTICYDIGSMSNFNLANTTVKPFLRSRGITRIDALFISHANIDHYNGAIEICRDFDVGTVYISEHFRQNAGRGAKDFLNRLEIINQPIKTLHRGCKLKNLTDNDENTYNIDILWPTAKTDTKLDSNNSSLTLNITTQNGRILLTGDLAESAQQTLIQNNTNKTLQADILLLPHHGSITKTLPGFVEAVNPDYCINSCGRLFDRSISKLKTTITPKTYHTSQNGAITVELGEDGIDIETFH